MDYNSFIEKLCQTAKNPILNTEDSLENYLCQIVFSLICGALPIEKTFPKLKNTKQIISAHCGFYALVTPPIHVITEPFSDVYHFNTKNRVMNNATNQFEIATHESVQSIASTKNIYAVLYDSFPFWNVSANCKIIKRSKNKTDIKLFFSQVFCIWNQNNKLWILGETPITLKWNLMTLENGKKLR